MRFTPPEWDPRAWKGWVNVVEDAGSGGGSRLSQAELDNSEKSARVRVRRVYEKRLPEDGTRVLVDRLWPRGLARADADLDDWCKDVAPSTELRKWYSHEPERFEEFGHRYSVELEDPERAGAVAHLRDLMSDQTLTLLTATTRPEISEAVVLAAILRRPPPTSGERAST